MRLCVVNTNTRIMVYNGHREISLVVAGRQAPPKSLVLAGLRPACFPSGRLLMNDVGKWPFITFKSLDMALKKSQKSLDSPKWPL